MPAFTDIAAKGFKDVSTGINGLTTQVGTFFNNAATQATLSFNVINQQTIGVGRTVETVADKFKKLKGEMSAAVNVASSGFEQAKGSIINFVKAADPTRYAIFEQQLEIASMHLGRTFIPLLTEATYRVREVAKYFANLSDTQRENILHWSKLFLQITGTVFALKFVIGIGSQLVTVWTGVNAVFKAFNLVVGGGPIGLILKLAAAIVLAKEASEGFSLGGIGRAFQRLGDFLSPVIQGLERFWEKIRGPVIEIGTALEKVFTALLDVIGKVASGLWDAFGDTVIEAMKVVLEVVSAIAGAISDVADTLDDLWQGSWAQDAKRWLLNSSERVKELEQQDADKARKKAEREQRISNPQGRIGNNFSPLPANIKSGQLVGVEEVFKRGLSGATFDPKKLSEYERMSLEIDKQSREYLREISQRVRGRSPATQVGGDF